MVIRVPPTAENGSSEVFTVDFRETAPARASKTMFVDNPLAAQIGGLSVAVPGELRGLEAARHLWGNSSLPWHKLVEPSVELAAGWTVDVELAKRLQNPVGDCHRTPSPLLMHHRTTRSSYLPAKTGVTYLPQEGGCFVRVKLYGGQITPAHSTQLQIKVPGLFTRWGSISSVLGLLQPN